MPLPGVLAAGMPPSSVQGCIHSVSWNRTKGGYEIEDIDDLYNQMSTEYKRLPRLHDQLWTIFAGVRNRQDLEQYRQILIPVYGEDGDGVFSDGLCQTL